MATSKFLSDITVDGDVGIGTTDPTTKLHLHVGTTTITPLLTLHNGTSTNGSVAGASIDFVASGSASAIGSRIIGTRVADGAHMDLRFHTQRDNFAMIIDENQNVGIGTTSPSEKLHVVGNAIISGGTGDATLTIEADTDNVTESDNPNIKFKQDGGLVTGDIGFVGSAGEIYTDSLSNALYMVTNGNYPLQLGVDGAASLTIENNGGNVGIGTNDPAYKLDVAGETRIALTADDRLIINQATANTNFGLQFAYNGTRNWDVYNQGTATSPLYFYSQQLAGPALTLRSDGVIRFDDYGAGILQTDSSGNISVDTSTYLTSVSNDNWSGTDLSIANGGTGASSASAARTNLGLGSLATLSSVNASTITDNSVGAAELNVTGNGTTSQFLRSDGDGTFTWATPSVSVDWSEIQGDQSNINNSGFTNDAGYVTSSGVTSVSGTGTKNGLTLTGTVTSTGNLTLGGTLAISDDDWSGTDLAIANGGTGASSASAARTNLGLGTAATSASTDFVAVSGDTMTGALTIDNFGVLTNWNTSNTDIDGLIDGSTFGGLLQGPNSGHFVLGLKDNDAADSFAVMSGSGNYTTDDTYDKLCFRVKADGSILVPNGNIIMGSQYGIRFNDANTRIYTNSDSPEDLIIEADQNLHLNPDGNVELGSRLLLNTIDANTSSTTALVLNGSEVEKRTLGSNAFNSTTIPTNNNQLTNGAGYVTGVAWNELGGDQSEIPVSGFNNDAGYLTAHPNISAASSSDNSGRTYIQDITLDSNGHVTGITTATETVTDTNTTYSAGTGLDLNGTTFSIESDLRDVTYVGKDGNNYIYFDSANSRADFYVGGVFVARLESDGDLHVKGDVIAFSNIFA